MEFFHTILRLIIDMCTFSAFALRKLVGRSFVKKDVFQEIISKIKINIYRGVINYVPSSQRKFEVFFDFNHGEVWCVEGLDYYTYMEITSNVKKASDFLWACISERDIQIPSCGIRTIDMSENGIDFKNIENRDNFDDSNESPIATFSPQSITEEDDTINSFNDETTTEIEADGEETPEDVETEAIVENVTREDNNAEKKQMEELDILDYFVKCENGYICIMCPAKSSNLHFSENLETHLETRHKMAL
ncbi:hypothetical protein KQX54_013149 [Cotesia glomerata]|uniref:Uncharacterized protein n=1 Tax=Cotesia glomerata TaxID=32391 RepID=A0AAV7I0Q1_COTGL|nr:hypothetical protein KQX54_013149 [Cotesia glomerata]